ncbi:hypothetical protein [Amycolatopsis sp. lyj-112]|uniref:hypothetical protein n=1 Tax=Amycolatopsis sp. lyj-112 TaxID=2789288 RepID=UPI00397E61AA
MGRLTALVLLDAVNERAVHLAVQTLPDVEVKPRDTFEDMHNKVKNSLGVKWDVTRSGWADVRTLHRSRNSAQHEGVGADPTLLPGWSIATESYTNSVVAAVFDIELGTVHLSSAIQTSELRSYLQSAEELLDQGKAGEALGKVDAAFSPAFQEWLQVHERAEGGRSRISYEMKKAGLDKIVTIARDLTAAQAFATDPGEYVWFSELRQAGSAMVTVEEVNRALVFVFWWIVRWEAVNATLVSNFDRAVRLDEQRIRAISREVPWQSARINALHAVPMQNYGGSRVSFDIGNLPAEEDRRADWSIAIREKLKTVDVVGVSQWQFTWPSEISAVALHDANTDVLIASVLELLRDAESDVIAAAERRAEETAREQAERDAYELEFARHRGEFPDWVESAFLSAEKLILNGEVQSRLRLEVDESITRVYSEASALLRERDVTIRYSYNTPTIFEVSPELAISDLIAVLRGIDSEICAKATEAQLLFNEQAAAAAAAEAAHEALQANLIESIKRSASS